MVEFVSLAIRKARRKLGVSFDEKTDGRNVKLYAYVPGR